MDRKLCMDCKYFSFSTWSPFKSVENFDDRCWHENNLDLVKNSPIYSPKILRNNKHIGGNKCGKIGEWFELKEPEPPKESELLKNKIKQESGNLFQDAKEYLKCLFKK